METIKRELARPSVRHVKHLHFITTKILVYCLCMIINQSTLLDSVNINWIMFQWLGISERIIGLPPRPPHYPPQQTAVAVSGVI